MFSKDAEVGKVGISISVEIPDEELPGQGRIVYPLADDPAIFGSFLTFTHKVASGIQTP
jgi:hypothetical protein